MSTSRFAMALRQILDDTWLFTRSEWSRFLGVEERVIVDWTEDRTVPHGNFLRVILDVLQTTADIPQKPLDEFLTMASLPAGAVSPNGDMMLCRPSWNTCGPSI